MLLTIDIPDDVAVKLGMTNDGNASRSALERLALAGYQEGTLSRFQVQKMLGFDNRWETEEWLGTHGATVLYTLEDLEQDRATLDRILSGRQGP